MNLEYFHLFDYHDINQAESAAKEFKNKFIEPFSEFLENSHFQSHKEVKLHISVSDVIDALHMAKHSLQYFSQLFQVAPNPHEKYKPEELPPEYVRQYGKLRDKEGYPEGFGLIGNVGTCNDYKQAAAYAYWIAELKPLLWLEIMPSPVASKHKIFFHTYLNEYFALYLAFGFCTKSDERIKDVDHHHLEEFVRSLRYKYTSVESLSIFLEIWISGLLAK